MISPENTMHPTSLSELARPESEISDLEKSAILWFIRDNGCHAPQARSARGTLEGNLQRSENEAHISSQPGA